MYLKTRPNDLMGQHPIMRLDIDPIDLAIRPEVNTDREVLLNNERRRAAARTKVMIAAAALLALFWI